MSSFLCNKIPLLHEGCTALVPCAVYNRYSERFPGGCAHPFQCRHRVDLLNGNQVILPTICKGLWGLCEGSLRRVSAKGLCE
eukprot:135795-Prorocentrum_minimum.AAC.2